MNKLLNTIFLASLLATGCGQKPAPSTANPPAPQASNAPVEVAKPPTEEKKLIEDTQYISDKLKTIPTLAKVVIYTEETDPNHLLGRPGQYTAKVNFADSRYKNLGLDVGTVEVFKNLGDLDRRYDYVDQLGKQTTMALRYQYKHGNLLMRLDHALTPTQAKEFEAAFNSM